MYVCMNVYIYIHIHNVCMYVCMYLCIYACMCVCIQALHRRPTNIRPSWDFDTRTHTYTHAHTRIYVYHMYICISLTERTLWQSLFLSLSAGTDEFTYTEFTGSWMPLLLLLGLCCARMRDMPS